ncbi:MAG: hypothetical protein A2075_03110 [Geobacteraceae bacterium GWC2_58_44]|nr:MAG: hypothetical protein A2075_03110 [Geobacteraceae bacterium GWC2_58_44]
MLDPRHLTKAPTVLKPIFRYQQLSLPFKGRVGVGMGLEGGGTYSGSSLLIRFPFRSGTR